MESRSGSGDGTRLLRKDRLIALLVQFLIGAVDVGRQRHMAEFLDIHIDGEIIYAAKADRAETEFPSRQDFAFQFASAKYHLFSDVHLSPWANQGFP